MTQNSPTSTDITTQALVVELSEKFLPLTFVQDTAFYWSPKDRTIHYRAENNQIGNWSLLHELSHALLGHQDYKSDIELLIMESQAWHHAKLLAQEHEITIDEDHIQDCLDTYRDWLYHRSCCPRCTNAGLQFSLRLYRCFNCHASWQVSTSRFNRPYRIHAKQSTQPTHASPIFI
jgi:hypothetical protein